MQSNAIISLGIILLSVRYKLKNFTGWLSGTCITDIHSLDYRHTKNVESVSEPLLTETSQVRRACSKKPEF